MILEWRKQAIENAENELEQLGTELIEEQLTEQNTELQAENGRLQSVNGKIALAKL
ncbi:MAG: hypothetical protein NC311_13205 [Muribaculaceae bacterium]|nr:hypothetical protein [Muribaculaceae bacterium]